MSSTPTAPRTKLEQNQTNISYLIFPGVPPHLLWRYRGPVAFVVSSKVNLIAADHNKFKTTSSDIFEKIKTAQGDSPYVRLAPHPCPQLEHQHPHLLLEGPPKCS